MPGRAGEWRLTHPNTTVSPQRIVTHPRAQQSSGPCISSLSSLDLFRRISLFFHPSRPLYFPLIGRPKTHLHLQLVLDALLALALALVSQSRHGSPWAPYRIQSVARRTCSSAWPCCSWDRVGFFFAANQYHASYISGNNSFICLVQNTGCSEPEFPDTENLDLHIKRHLADAAARSRYNGHIDGVTAQLRSQPASALIVSPPRLPTNAIMTTTSPPSTPFHHHSSNANTNPRQNDPNKTCPTCNRTFTRPSDLARHSLIHQPHVRKYECWAPGCKYNGEQGFVRKDKLVDHQRARHGMRAVRGEE